jgi:hypothetical protein
MRCFDLLIEKSRDWTLYSVHILGPKGKWSGERTMLLGDAAHAVSEGANIVLCLSGTDID